MPGAIFDSATSNRSTANRDGVVGSTDGIAEPDAAGEGEGVLAGVPDAAGGMIDVTV